MCRGSHNNKYYSMCSAVFASALLQAFAMRFFLMPASLLPSGFTGVATLLEYAAKGIGLNFPVSAGVVALNVPVAVLCWKHVGKKFVLFSLMQIFLMSIFLNIIPSLNPFEDILLNICFGGTVYGLSAVIALRGNASTGGTDFIALYISNRLGKSIWKYVFIFNTVMLCLFGYMTGWENAGYSILFQFISTRMIDSFYHRYKRVTLQITSERAENITEAYVNFCRHGISVVDGYGGFSRKKFSLLHTVVSAYEVQDLVAVIRNADPDCIINVLPTENFWGGFYQKPLE